MDLPFVTLNNGTYSTTLDNLPAGTYTVTARYAGDGNFTFPASFRSSNSNGRTRELHGHDYPQTFNTSTCDTAAATSFAYGSIMMIQVTVAGASGEGEPTGTVTITQNGTTYANLPLDPATRLFTRVLFSRVVTDGSSGLHEQQPVRRQRSVGYAASGGLIHHRSNVFRRFDLHAWNGDDGSYHHHEALAQHPRWPLSPPDGDRYGGPSYTDSHLQRHQPGFIHAHRSRAPNRQHNVQERKHDSGNGDLVPQIIYSVGGPNGDSPEYTYGAAATLTTTAITTTGSNPITAVYAGDNNYNTETSSALAITVATGTATTTTLTSSANPTPVGAQPTLTATVSGSPTSGTVTFYDGTTVLGSTKLSTKTKGGVVTYTSLGGTSSSASSKGTTSQPGLAAGTHSLTAAYSGATGSPALLASTSAVYSQVISQVSIDISLSAKTVGKTGQTYMFCCEPGL